ncbi:MAG: FAD-dependent oxidoreductase [Planctomycetes bacterium]|nr:FAD-dependent oxidoreductase [Planctomycetota bacterium]
MRYDALIIGAGLSGLGAGIRLAQFGKRVAILEKHSVWGGLNSFYKLEGRLFDSGLHAFTNYVPRGERTRPLGKILRQLRIDHDALELGEQTWSAIRFADAELKFSNDFELLRSEIARVFPSETANFDRLVADLPDYDVLDGRRSGVWARAELTKYFREPLLVEMLMCPLCFYGSAHERDVEWEQFAILFRSLFLEGFARPAGGIRAVLDVLVKRFKAEGGEIKLRSGVRRIVIDGGEARGVELENGAVLEAEHVFSSAGRVETRRLCGAADEAADVGRLSFIEAIAVTERTPRESRFDGTAIFFNDSPRFEYARPDELVDARSGVICTPNNYATPRPLAEGMLRVTLLANYDRWTALGDEDYAREKARATELAFAAAARFAFDVRGREVFQDTFTPRTIERFTGHLGGAIYGSPRKSHDGSSGVERLSLIGTDQGLVGIVGALLSGITIANRREQQSTRTAP